MTYNLEDKEPGDLIKSGDWNDTMDRIKNKVNKVGAESMSGPLTIEETLTIGTRSPDQSIVLEAPTGWFRFGPGDDSGRIFAEYGPQLAPILKLSDYDDPPRIQFQQTGTGDEADPQHSAWIGMARNRSNDLTIQGGKVGIGTTDPQQRLHVGGGIRVNGDIIKTDDWGITVGGTKHSSRVRLGELYGESGVYGLNGLKLGSSQGHVQVRIDGEDRIMGGNPVQYVQSVRLSADDGSDYGTVNLGSTRNVFAFVTMIGCDPRHNFDRGDAFAVDIYQVDGSTTPTWGWGGEHWGPFGSTSNVKIPTFKGRAQTIQFRARSQQDATVDALGIVFFD